MKPANTRALRSRYWLLTSLLALLIVVPAGYPQSTYHLSFEEYTDGTTPPFVRAAASTPSFPSGAAVGSNPSIPAYEGQKYLGGLGIIYISAPNSEPIAQYTVHYYIPGPRSSAFGTGIGLDSLSQRDPPNNTWLPVSRTVLSPGGELFISASDPFEGNPINYALDAIDLVTIPEPSTLTLLALGSGILALPLVVRRRRG